MASRSFRAWLRNYNFGIHIAVFLTLVVIYFIVGLLYEGMMLETLHAGAIGNAIITALATLLYFPFNTIFEPDSTLVHFIGIAINLNLYSTLIILLTKALLNRI